MGPVSQNCFIVHACVKFTHTVKILVYRWRPVCVLRSRFFLLFCGKKKNVRSFPGVRWPKRISNNHGRPSPQTQWSTPSPSPSNSPLSPSPPVQFFSLTVLCLPSPYGNVTRPDVTWRGSSFQTRGAAATGKARSLTVDNRVRPTISDDDDTKRRRPRASRSEDWRNSSERYDGAVLHVDACSSENSEFVPDFASSL